MVTVTVMMKTPKKTAGDDMHVFDCNHPMVEDPMAMTFHDPETKSQSQSKSKIQTPDTKH